MRLLALGRAGATFHVERIVRGWRRCDRYQERHEAGRRHRARGLTVTQDEGMVVVRGRLEPEVGALLLRALEAARETLHQRARRTPAAPGDPEIETTVPQRHADALALVAEAALAQGLDPGAPGERYQVVVHVDAPVLADPAAPGQSLVEDGAHVSPETSRRLACDASTVTMRHGPDGQTLDVGRRTRTIPPAIRRALLHRDTTCRFPGCHVRFGQGHHLRHWAEGGAHEPGQPRAALPAAPSRRARGGVSGGAGPRRRAALPAARRVPITRCPGRRESPRRSRRRPAGRQRGGRRHAHRPHGTPELGRRAPRRGLCA